MLGRPIDEHWMEVVASACTCSDALTLLREGGRRERPKKRVTPHPVLHVRKTQHIRLLSPAERRRHQPARASSSQYDCTFGEQLARQKLHHSQFSYTLVK